MEGACDRKPESPGGSKEVMRTTWPSGAISRTRKSAYRCLMIACTGRQSGCTYVSNPTSCSHRRLGSLCRIRFCGRTSPTSLAVQVDCDALSGGCMTDGQATPKPYFLRVDKPKSHPKNLLSTTHTHSHVTVAEAPSVSHVVDNGRHMHVAIIMHVYQPRFLSIDMHAKDCVKAK